MKIKSILTSFVVILLVLVLIVSSWAQQTRPLLIIQGTPDTTTNPPEVRTYASVVNRGTAQSIEGLSAKDFRIEEAGNEVDTLGTSYETVGLAVVVVVDRGGISAPDDPRIKEVKNLTCELMDNLSITGAKDDDIIAIIGVGEDGDLQPEENFSYNPVDTNLVKNALADMEASTVRGGTPLYEGLDEAILVLTQNSNSTIRDVLTHRRKVIVVFSDGIDPNFSDVARESDIIHKANEQDISLYTIGMARHNASLRSDDNLERLAYQTDGLYQLHNNDETHQQTLNLFDRLMTQRNQYLLTYETRLPKRDYTLNVGVTTSIGSTEDSTTFSSILETPQIMLTSPTDSLQVTVPYSRSLKKFTPTSIEFAVQIMPVDGAERYPTEVQYVANGQIIGESTTAPNYPFIWQVSDIVTVTREAQTGQYTLLANAVDAYLDTRMTSEPVDISVTWEKLPTQEIVLNRVRENWWILLMVPVSALGLMLWLIQMRSRLSPEVSSADLQRLNRKIDNQVRRHGLIEVSDLKGRPIRKQVSLLENYAESTPGLALTFSSDKHTLSLKRLNEFRKIKDAWQLLQADKEDKHIQSINDIIECLAFVLQLPKEEIEIHKYQQVYYTTFNSAQIFQGLNVPSLIPILFFLENKLEQYHLDAIRHVSRNLLNSSDRVLLFFTTMSDKDPSWPLQLERLGYAFAYDLVPFGYDGLRTIVSSQNPRRVFKQQVLKCVNLTVVSPYTMTGPVSDNVFFGREPETREIVEHSQNESYVVIGGRRIGKSSLLGRLHRIRLPAAGFQTLYHDCSSTPTRNAFLNATIRNWRPEPPPAAPATFNDLLQSPPSDKRLVLLLDEVDKLVPADRADGWSLFNMLRAMSNSGHAQIVLSGERTLKDALRDSEGPLFNFANEILIGPLDFHAVEELITRPMKQLEIELENEKVLVNRIWAFTSGHPNVVQRLCRRLIERLKEQNKRYITLNDLEAVIEDPGFQRDDFLSTYWEAATPLEKIISLLMSDNREVRTLQSLRRALEDRCGLHPSAREIDDALQRLVDLRSILKRTPTGYEFAVKAFPRVVAGTMTLNDMLMILTEEYEEQGE